jgi:hypothetical protein
VATKHIYLIKYRNQLYLDYQTLLYLFAPQNEESKKRSKLWRYLRKSKIKRAVIKKNNYIFLLEDILGDVKLIEMAQNLTALLAAMEEE